MATLRRMGLGSPSSIGAIGAPIHRSGGATTMRSRCWIMCACNSCWPSGSSGELSARMTLASPAMKAMARPALNRSGIRRESVVHPRR